MYRNYIINKLFNKPFQSPIIQILNNGVFNNSFPYALDTMTNNVYKFKCNNFNANDSKGNDYKNIGLYKTCIKNSKSTQFNNNDNKKHINISIKSCEKQKKVVNDEDKNDEQNKESTFKMLIDMVLFLPTVFTNTIIIMVAGGCLIMANIIIVQILGLTFKWILTELFLFIGKIFL